MATRQQYLDDLERRMMVRVTVNASGEKVYSVPGAFLNPPAFYAMPYMPERMTPAEWRAGVLQNFTDVYLAWWTESFDALRAQIAGQPKDEAQETTTVAVYNPDTGLWENQVVQIHETVQPVQEV